MNDLTIVSTIRHAYTQYNAEKRYAGTIDVSLNDKGKSDAKLAEKRLKNINFDLVISSKMKRAIETSLILTDGRIPIIRTKRCIERNFGVFEGHTWEEVQKFEPPVLFIKVGNDLHSVNPKGSESFEDLWFRAKKFSKFIFNNFTGKHILVVSHGVFLQMLHGVLRGSNCIESLAYYPRNLELSTFYYSGKKYVKEEIYQLIDMEKEKF